jgi:superfamily II DNA or RNA helicase
MKQYVEKLGFKVGLYTGRQTTEERENNKELFQQGKIDILIGSTPIGTGVDGLQKICDRMILMSLPWTHSEYDQLIGRIIRQGSNFKKVDIIIPKVIINYIEDGKHKTWSRDRHKLNVIRFKKDLFGIVVNGIIPSNIVTDLTSIKRKTIDSLNEIIKKVNNGEIEINRDEVIKEFLTHSDLDKYRRKLGEFSEIQRLWSVRKSNTNFILIKEDKSIWDEYHKQYRKIREDWTEEYPYKVIANKINKLNKPNLIIADFGCGDNL